MSPWTAEAVLRHLMERSSWRYSRASGPGGQRRDHAETRAELHVPRAAVEGLPEDVAERLGAGLGLARRPLRLTAQAERSRERNRELVEARLRARVERALAPGPPPRRPTRPTAGAAVRRRADKTRRARVKVMRRAPDAAED
jgi:ribosome-associated protein